MKILLKIAYDGTNYFGWQYQPNVITIEKQLGIALSKIYNHKIMLRGASRTDTKVNALAQHATFLVEKSIIPLDRIPQVVNKILPSDIVVISAREVSEEFDARYDAKEKTYTYRIQNSETVNPINRNSTYCVRKKLDVDLMNEGAKYFLGTHDFSAFRSLGGSVKSTVRTIHEIHLTREGEIITLTVRGDSFLYNMVRIMVGTLIKVGKKKIMPCHVADIILSKDRSFAGNTAEPQGLTLVDIKYEH